MTSFNLNDYVKIKLTEEGCRIWLEQIKLYEQYDLATQKKMKEYLASFIDEEGYLTTQMWNLKRVFDKYKLNIPFENGSFTKIDELEEKQTFGL